MSDTANQERSRALHHVVGVTWVIGAAMVTLVPALHHGAALGPYDILTRSGLTRSAGTAIRNSSTGDQVAEMIPWSTLAWMQVHAGHIPLWDPYGGLGLPLVFNWQSAAFSLPTVIGYLFPIHIAYTVQIIVTVVVAGTGAYVFARVLHIGVIGCATAGTIYELSGSFMGWLGWPHAAVMSWAGWILAMTVLIVRGRRRVLHVVAFAVFLALAVYSGQPEILTMLLLSVAVFFVAMVAATMITEHDHRLSFRPVGDLILGVVAGTALAAPLLLPGVQVLSGSTRNSGTLLARTEVGKALSPHDLIHLFVQGYNGLPIAGNQMFGDAVYFDTAAYLGIIGIGLAVLGVVRGWRRAEVVSLLAVTIVSLVIVFAPPFEAVVLHLPFVQTIDWHRDLMMLSLCTAVLAGLGIDAVVRVGTKGSVQILLGSILALGVGFLAVLWLVGAPGFSALDAAHRRESLKVPLVTTALALIVVVLWAAWTSRNGRESPGPADEDGAVSQAPPPHRPAHIAGPRRALPVIGQLAAGLLLLLETVFLVVSGAQLWSSSGTGVTTTPAVATLLRTIGSSTVGFGTFTCYAGPAVTALGILPEANSLYGVHEFDFYDPVLPQAYLRSWAEVSQDPAGVPIYNSFCPVLSSAEQARRYGVGYVLQVPGRPGPTGAVFVGTVGDEDLYRIPGAAAATLTPVSSKGVLPADDAPGKPVAVSHPSPSSWKMTTAGDREQVLRLRLTDEPGWQATIDGKPLKLVPYADVMLQAVIPPGDHSIELHYWPPLFTVGLILAACAAALLLTASIMAMVRARRSSRPSGAKR
jgi:Bacterial membrane protein YfhO